MNRETSTVHDRRIDALRYYAAALVITHHVMFQLDSGYRRSRAPLDARRVFTSSRVS
jgi:hypothetical protein